MPNILVSKNISFSGRITPDFIKATNILRDFKNQGIISSTFEIYRHIKPSKLQDRLKSQNLAISTSSLGTPDTSIKIKELNISHSDILTKNKYYSKLMPIINSKENEIRELRKLLREKKYNKTINPLTVMGFIVKNYKIGNCMEQSILIQEKLINAGIFAKVTGRQFIDHCFVVCNLSKNADITNPKTWGKKSFIVDPWLNKVFRSKEEAFCEYKRIYSNTIEHLRNIQKKDNNIIWHKYLKPEQICNYVPMKINYQ